MDMQTFITPRSDQFNSEDFLVAPRVFTIAGVKFSESAEQPVDVRLAGETRVWRPCKTTGRIMAAAWGLDHREYVGRKVELFRDPTVKVQGKEVGGIRISGLSHIARQMEITVSVSRGVRKPYTVRPLPTDEAVNDGALEAAMAAASKGREAFADHWRGLSPQTKAALKPHIPEFEAAARRAADLPTPEELARAEAEALAAIRSSEAAE